LTARVAMKVGIYTKGGHRSRFSAGQKSVSWSAQSVVDEVHP
jgi:hypothetical protein